MSWRGELSDQEPAPAETAETARRLLDEMQSNPGLLAEVAATTTASPAKSLRIPPPRPVEWKL